MKYGGFAEVGVRLLGDEEYGAVRLGECEDNHRSVGLGGWKGGRKEHKIG